MMHVVFPNGQRIRYNEANFLQHGDDHTWILKDKRDGQNIAFIQASAGVLVEFVQPCAVTNPIACEMTPETALELVIKHLRTLPAQKVKALKAALFAFNAKRCTWRE